MQAVIMAGGEGTRLRPLTCSVPKPLTKLCGKPVIMYILDLLIKNGFDRATMTLMYKADRITEAFDDDSYMGMKLFFETEERPLGTAGSVKNAARQDEVLVISGDAMCDFELRKAIEFHHQTDADATIIVRKADDPREFGLVTYDTSGKVTGFIEKPSYESCITDMANTGIYIISKSVLDIIPDNEKSDFAQDIFPLMMKRNMKIYAYEERGYWCDIGDINSYLRCQRDMLEGRVNCRIDGIRDGNGVIYAEKVYDCRGVKIEAPSYIGRNVSVCEGTVIRKGSILCEGVSIGCGCVIASSVILDGAFIGERTNVTGAVICENARISHDCIIDEKAVIGEDAKVSEGSSVRAGVKVWRGRTIEKYQDVFSDVVSSDAAGLYLDDDGIRGGINTDITPSVVTRLGSSLGSLYNSSVAVGYRKGRCSQALSYALASGVLASGKNVWNFGECTLPQLAYCMERVNAVSGCFIESGKTVNLKILSESGLPVTRKEERKIEAGLNRNEFSKADIQSFGQVSDCSQIKMLYELYLSSFLPEKLDGICTEIRTTDMYLAAICDRVIFSKNDMKGRKIVIHLSGDGKKVSFYSDETGSVPYEKLVLLACRIMFEKGNDVSLPFSFPSAAEKLAGMYGRSVYRYYNCSCDSSDKKARQLAKKCSFARDGLLLTVIILSYLAKYNTKLDDAFDGLPEFYSACRYVSLKSPPSEVMKNICICKAGINEGVVVDDKAGRVLVRPTRSGRGVMMFVESFRSETAGELCDRFEKLIRENRCQRFE